MAGAKPPTRAKARQEASRAVNDGEGEGGGAVGDGDGKAVRWLWRCCKAERSKGKARFARKRRGEKHNDPLRGKERRFKYMRAMYTISETKSDV